MILDKDGLIKKSFIRRFLKYTQDVPIPHRYHYNDDANDMYVRGIYKDGSMLLCGTICGTIGWRLNKSRVPELILINKDLEFNTRGNYSIECFWNVSISPDLIEYIFDAKRSNKK